MLALTLGQAKTFAILVVVGLIVLAVASAWFMKQIGQKIAFAVILVLLAVLVWTQRSSLQECSDKVRANDASAADTTCSFFGRDIDVKRNRDT